MYWVFLDRAIITLLAIFSARILIMAGYASLEDAFKGGPWAAKKQAEKTFSSPTRRTEATLQEHAKLITDLTKSLPIATADTDMSDTYGPARIVGTSSGMNQREPFSVQDYRSPEIPPTGGFAYESPVPGENSSRGWDRKLDVILQHMRAQEQKQQSSRETPTADLLLFVFTGVFFIFVLDTFVTLGRKSK
jgi:hypothetical protein